MCWIISQNVYLVFKYMVFAYCLQLILINPVCVVAYIVASWKFFRDRILVEELTLLNFFGEDYIHYQEKVPTGLPYIKGYKLDLWLEETHSKDGEVSPINPSVVWLKQLDLLCFKFWFSIVYYRYWSMTQKCKCDWYSA